jgi:hypothetical protein
MVRPVVSAHRPNHPPEVHPAEQSLLPAQVPVRLVSDLPAEAPHEMLAAEDPAVPCFAHGGLGEAATPGATNRR